MLKTILRFGAEKTAKGRTKGVVIYIFSYNLECGWEVPHKNYRYERNPPVCSSAQKSTKRKSQMTIDC